jgi:hypothetical protein
MASSALDITTTSTNLNEISFQTAQTSGDYDNPWESAANDETYRSSSLRMNSTSDNAGNAGNAGNADSRNSAPSSFKTRCMWWNQLFEGFLSSLFVVFFFFLYRKNSTENKNEHEILVNTIIILSALLAVLLLLRSICGGRFLLYNMNSRPFVALLYLLTGGLLYGYASKLPDSWIMALQHGHKAALPIILAILAALELVQYFLLRHYYYQEQADLNDTTMTSRYSHASRFSPWWWNGNTTTTDDLGEPLLNGQPFWTSNSNTIQMQHGASSSSWWPFSSRGNNHNGSNRDDGSVDYASINEDWATRSQTDPHWWSREDDH